MVDELIADLAAGNPTVQNQALSTIASDSFTETEAAELIIPVIDLLDCENALVRMTAPKTIASLADAHGATLGPRIRHRLQDLLPLLNEESEQRGPISYLIGSIGTKEAVHELDNRFEDEVDTVQSSIEDGFHAATTNAIEELKKDDLSDDDSVLKGLLYLSRRYPKYPLEHEKDLLQLLDGPNGGAVSDVFINLCSTDADTDSTEEALKEKTLVEPGDSDATITGASNSLSAVTRSRMCSSAVEEAASRYIGWLEQESQRVRENALTLLSPIAKNSPQHLDGELDPITRLVVQDEEVGGRALEVFRSYAIAEVSTPSEYLQRLLVSTGGQPAFIWLQETLEVLRYKSDHRWQKPDLGVLGRGFIVGLSRAQDDERTAPVFWPTFEPKMAVAAAVAALLEELPDQGEVVLYTKGTQTQWGGTTEVREEYGHFGIHLPDLLQEDETEVIPLDEILPTDYVYQGTRKTRGEKRGPASLVIVRNQNQLEVVDTLGPTLFNFHSRVTHEEEGYVDALVEEDSDRLICPIYSLFSKREHGGNRVPEYRPPELNPSVVIPDTRIIQESLSGSSGQSSSRRTSPLDADIDLQSLCSEHDVRLERVDGDTILEQLSEGYEAAEFLLNHEESRAGWRSFSYLQRFERLPVPAEVFDSWVMDKRRRGKQGMRSWTMAEFVEEFGDFANQMEGLARPGTSDVREELENLLIELKHSNPLFEEICNRVDKAIQEGRTLAIFTPSPSIQTVLEEQLIKETTLTRTKVRKGAVQVVNRDTVRDISDCDELLIPGPQRQQHIGFHIHPAATQVTVLTYGGRWQQMLRRRLQNYVDELNSILQTTSTKYIPQISVTARGDEKTDEGESVEVHESDGEPMGGKESVDTASADEEYELDLQERIAESIDESGLNSQYTHDRTRYDDYDYQEFAIKTESGEVLRRDAGSRVLIEADELDGISKETVYKWVSPRELSAGTVLLHIEDNLWNQLWDEWLDEQYKQIDGGGATEYLETWYESIQSILTAVQKSTGAQEPDNREVLDAIVERLQDVGIERGENRIRAWFESVANADNALELAKNPSLTMAPRSSEDIQDIGRAFDKVELEGELAQMICKSRNKIQGAHIHEGHKFRQDISAALSGDEEGAERIRAGIQKYEVTDVEDVTDIDES